MQSFSEKIEASDPLFPIRGVYRWVYFQSFLPAFFRPSYSVSGRPSFLPSFGFPTSFLYFYLLYKMASGYGSEAARRHRQGKALERAGGEEYGWRRAIDRELADIASTTKEATVHGDGTQDDGQFHELQKQTEALHKRAAYLDKREAMVASAVSVPLHKRAVIGYSSSAQARAAKEAERAAEIEAAEIEAEAIAILAKSGYKPEGDLYFKTRMAATIKEIHRKREKAAAEAPPPSSAPVERAPAPAAAAAAAEHKEWTGPTKSRYTKNFTVEDEADTWVRRRAPEPAPTPAAPAAAAPVPSKADAGPWRRGSGATAPAAPAAPAASAASAPAAPSHGYGSSDLAASSRYSAAPSAAPSTAADLSYDIIRLIKDHHCVYKKIGENRYQVEVFGKYVSESTRGKGFHAQKMMEEGIVRDLRAALERTGKVSIAEGPRGTVGIVSMI